MNYSKFCRLNIAFITIMERYDTGFGSVKDFTIKLSEHKPIDYKNLKYKNIGLTHEDVIRLNRSVLIEILNSDYYFDYTTRNFIGNYVPDALEEKKVSNIIDSIESPLHDVGMGNKSINDCEEISKAVNNTPLELLSTAVRLCIKMGADHPFADGNKRTGLLIGILYLSKCIGKLVGANFSIKNSVTTCYHLRNGTIDEKSLLNKFKKYLYLSSLDTY